MKSTNNGIAIFHALIRDKRFALVCNARYADYSVVAIEFCYKPIASFELQHDGSNAVECVLHAIEQSIVRDKAFSLRIHALGKRPVYTVATFDSSDFEGFGAKHVRTTEVVADALRDALQEGLLKEDDRLSYCDAYISSTKYSKRLWLVSA